MDIKKYLLKIAGKENFELDENIGMSYLFSVCWKYSWMLVRGKVFSFGYRLISNDVFVGKNVKVLQKKKIFIGRKVKIHDGVYLDALTDSRGGIYIGDNVVIGRNTRIESTGSLASIGHGVRIGARTTFGSDCYFGAAGGIEIGEDVVAGQLIRFHSENHNYIDLTKLIKDQGVTHKGIKIGNNCWIGAGVVFLDGAKLGDGCVVGANAVVTKEFPDNSVIGGIPAKILKNRKELT